MKKVFSSLVLFFSAIIMYAAPWNGIEGYYAKPIKIDTDLDYSLKKEECEITGVAVHTTYEFRFSKQNKNVNAEIEFLGDGATGSLYESFPIPESLVIKVDGKKTDYEIFYENKKINTNEITEYDMRIPGIVKFSFVSNYNSKIELNYSNDPICVMSASQIIYTFYSEKSDENTKYNLVLLNYGDGKIPILDQKFPIKKMDSNRSEIEFRDWNCDNYELTNYPVKTISISLFDFGFDEGSSFYFNLYRQEIISEKKLLSLTKDQLRLFRNMFYAMHGYSFKDKRLQKYFESIEDFNYKVNPSFSENDFNEIEKQNIEAIRKIEESLVEWK